MKSFDTGSYIDTIQSNPLLYNQSHPDYKDSAKKFSKWKEIAQQYDIHSGEAAKAKWRNIRDSYVKHLKSLKNGGNPKRKYSSWPWSDKMEFLIPFVTGRQILLDAMEEDPSLFVKQEIWDESSAAPVEAILPDDPNQHQLMRSAAHQAEFLDSVKADMSDPTDLMMLSHARRIRGFSRKRQALLGVKIAQLVMEAELEDIAEAETPSTSALA